ncbi:hypothetical protein ACFQY4_10230 [Catellatospora bangladeshensis]
MRAAGRGGSGHPHARGEPREAGEHTPDAVVADGNELLDLLRKSL